MERLEQKTAGTYALSVATLDEDGEELTATAPATVTIRDGGGASVYSGSATPTLGLLSADVPVAELEQLDVYFCTWTDAAHLEFHSYLELCGGHLFIIPDFRDWDTAFADKTKYPEVKVRAARVAGEARFERAARLAYVRRGRRLTAIGDGRARLRLCDNAVRTLLSASIDAVALTGAELDAVAIREWGALDRRGGRAWTKDAAIAVHYEHGLDYPPEPVVNAAMLLARDYLIRSPLSSRAVSEWTDVGFLRLATAGRERPTGLPEVDEVAREFGRDRPNIG